MAYFCIFLNFILSYGYVIAGSSALLALRISKQILTKFTTTKKILTKWGWGFVIFETWILRNGLLMYELLRWKFDEGYIKRVKNVRKRVRIGVVKCARKIIYVSVYVYGVYILSSHFLNVFWCRCENNLQTHIVIYSYTSGLSVRMECMLIMFVNSWFIIDILYFRVCNSKHSIWYIPNRLEISC